MSQHLNNKGFSLVELMIALVLMAIGILAVLQMQIVGMQSSSIANQLSVATGLAREVIEDVQSWDVANPPVSGLFTSPGLPQQAYDRFQANRSATTIAVPGAGVFSATYTVTPIGPEFSTAAVTVTVTEVTGTGKTVTLTSHRRIL
jgi:prepilin-type N-terminal cleavage/methylation domain-containing protein